MDKRNSWSIAARAPIVASLTVCLAACSPGTSEGDGELSESFATLDERLAACEVDPRVVAGVASVEICAGADLFLREEFDGNGRSCATCHRVDNNFTIDVPFIETLPANDPLFVAEFNPALEGLEIPEQMRARGLILENADGFQPDPRVRFVLRAVPHNLSMGTSVDRAPGDPVTPPQDRTGWSGDGAPNEGQLRDFQTGAIIQHYTNSLDRVAGQDFRLASDAELDLIDLFMRQLGRTNELDLANVAMTDAGAEAGRVLFLGPIARCNVCHGNAGANASFGGGGNRNFNTGVESARNAALAGFPSDGGFLGAPENPDGSFGDGTFNTPPLVEAADTGPFFHTDTTISAASAHNTDTATTIEEAVAFYDSPAFNNSPSGTAGPIDLTEPQIDEIGRFLRAVNAAFNAQLAAKRLDAALVLVSQFGDENLATQQETLRLAGVEVDDAIDVLAGADDLNVETRERLVTSRALIDDAINAGTASDRQANAASARDLVGLVSAELGTGLEFVIGDGTVMF